MKYSTTELLEMYKKMVLGRKYEEKIITLINQGKVQGFFHLGIGQEGAQVGLVSALRSDDYFMPTHRFHPGLAVRMDLNKLSAEILGRRTGVCKGKAFTFHISSIEDKILPVTGNGMLGVGVPTAVGFAWSLKMDKKDSVVVTVSGDGMSAEGNVHEGMNIAGILKVPIVFFIENNGWAISNPIKTNNSVQQISTRAAGYGMPAFTCDGDDVVAVRETVEEALVLARKNQPVVVEAFTHRWRPHFEGEPQVYRDPKDIEEAKKHDPIKVLEAKLLAKNILTLEMMEEIAAKIQNEIEQSFIYAFNSPMPTPEETLDFNQVYASNLGGALE
ncbi:MAG: thiamine pyrophosphate-dependent dehydrogenase E1 component subunit alpha [Peptococcales bacterium]|jgi:TPP-dependent pyruvate/acetoin dehydrogenase alpha subunit